MNDLKDEYLNFQYELSFQLQAIEALIQANLPENDPLVVGFIQVRLTLINKLDALNKEP